LAFSNREHVRERKVTRAFKIEEGLDHAITNQAKKIGITTSSFVNQVLRRYTEWGQYIGPRSNFLTIDMEIFKSFLQELDDETIVEIARSSALVATHNYLKFRYQKVNFDIVINFIETLASNANIGEANIVESREEKNHYEINVRHSLGIKWSLFLSEYIQGIFSSFLEMYTSSEVSPLGCTIIAVKVESDF
jgi:hypothetical protein